MRTKMVKAIFKKEMIDILRDIFINLASERGDLNED